MNITLKDVPPELHERLREAASETGRSLNRQIIYTLERVVLPRRIDRGELASRIRQRRERVGGDLDLESLTDSIRDGRE